jgi:microcystin-dependent protein
MAVVHWDHFVASSAAQEPTEGAEEYPGEGAGGAGEEGVDAAAAPHLNVQPYVSMDFLVASIEAL